VTVAVAETVAHAETVAAIDSDAAKAADTTHRCGSGCDHPTGCRQ
jgi:hypothetical protein